MIYICVPCYNEARTVGLVLWKVRKVLADTGREYHILAWDDGSTDATPEILAGYSKALPLTVLHSSQRRGYARTVEALLHAALERSDRPKRDCAVLLHGDFSHGPEFISELIKRIESGADVVVGERTGSGRAPSVERLLRRVTPWLLGRKAQVAGIRDPSWGFAAFRLVTLRNVLRRDGGVLSSDGWAANAELVARVAASARRVESVAIIERHDLKQRLSRVQPWATAKDLWKAGRVIRDLKRGTRQGAGGRR